MGNERDLINDTLDKIYQKNARRIFATLVRLLGDIDRAEEALHDAFNSALSQWPKEGIPNNPTAWLVSTGRFQAIDQLRKESKHRVFVDKQQHSESIEKVQFVTNEFDVIEDDQLRLIFTCCHPAIDLKVQIPLVLREVCGLTTEEIASAYLLSPVAMAQRIVRGKAKIRESKIPYEVPDISEITSRLDAVLVVIYLIYNEGYSASTGETVGKVDLVNEAIRLARILSNLHVDPEINGLLALMLLNESRRAARTNNKGDIVLLAEQNRGLWHRPYIEEGTLLVQQALASNRFGFYTLQAAISAVHANAKSYKETDWDQITSIYQTLLDLEPSPIIELNYAIAVSMSGDLNKGLSLIEHIIKSDKLAQYHLLYASYGELLTLAKRLDEASHAFERALLLTQQAPEQRFIKQKINELKKMKKN